MSEIPHGTSNPRGRGRYPQNNSHIDVTDNNDFGRGRGGGRGRGRGRGKNWNQNGNDRTGIPRDDRNSFDHSRGRGRGRGGFQGGFSQAGTMQVTPQNDQKVSQVDPNDMKSWGRKDLAAFIKAFRESNEKVLVFPPTLDAKQRSIIHDICAVFDFYHESHGPKSARVLTIKKSDVDDENDTTSKGYRGAQLFPSLTCIKNSGDLNEINTKLQPLYDNMISGIKLESAKDAKRMRRPFTQQNVGKSGSKHVRRDQAYWKLQEFRKTLPAFKNGKRVVNALELSDVTIVCGETGSGKTTQIPQIIHQSGIIPPEKTIICTQPRRISALSVAHRVSEELGETCGNTCGYIIRFENETGPNTRIIYMTTGILLRRLQVDPELSGVGCVIVDEVHERDVETDFCLLLLRDRLRTQKGKKNPLKVIVMSATIQIDKLKNYFNSVNDTDVSVINIPGTLHPVEEYFLEDALRHTGDSLDNLAKYENKTKKENKDQHAGGNETYAQLHTAVFQETVEELCPFSTIVKLIFHCHQSNADRSGSILVFLPGWAQITKISSMLRMNPASRDLWILLLHSSLTSAEQQRVFQPPPKQYRKVVLATNIAETSITIDDVVWVIDSCLSKDTNYDPAGNVTSLKAVMIAKANGIQRRGRAGRCQKGVCYHLLPRETYNKLPDFLPPQMLRTSLEEICLQIKAIKNSEKCVTVLSRAMDAPAQESIQHSVDFLTSMSVFTENDERLTPLGAALAQLPIHPLLGKMLFAATCLGVLDSVSLIAASLSVKSPFMVPHPADRAAAQRALRSLDEGMLSDHFCVLRLYEKWVRGGRRNDYAYENFADPNSLRMLERTKNQLKGLVLRSPLVAHLKKDVNQVTSRYSENLSLIRLVILWSLYPRLATVEYRIKRAKLANVICWDGVPAAFSNGSALSRRRRQDFAERTFLVFFERIFIESNLNLSEATAVSPVDVSLCLKHIAICPLNEVPSVLLKDVESRFIPAFPFYEPSVDEEEGTGEVPVKAEVDNEETEVKKVMRQLNAEDVDDDEDEEEEEEEIEDTKAILQAKEVAENIREDKRQDSEVLKKYAAIFFDGGKKLYIAKKEYAVLIQQIRECMDYYLARAIVNLRADIFPDELVEVISRVLGEPCVAKQRFVEPEAPEPSGFSHNPVGNHFYINEEGQLTLGRPEQQVPPEVPMMNDEMEAESDDDFEVIYEDEDEEMVDEENVDIVTTASNFTATEIESARNVYGDLTVLQQVDTRELLSKATAQALKALERVNAAAKEEQAAATTAQKEKRRANKRGARSRLNEEEDD